MPKCAVKKCKNYTLKLQKKDGVSYFHFPQNIIQRDKWTRIIARDREDESYKPNASSVICSKHFCEDDMYVTKKGFKRIKKTAIPNIQSSSHAYSEVVASTSTVQEYYADGDEDELIDDDEMVDEETVGELGDDSEGHKRRDNKWSKPRHIGVKCTFCATEIVGHRYKCVQCDSVDLCTACEAGGRHGDHCIIRIPNPEIYASLVNYIESIRRVLARELSKLESPVQPIPAVKRTKANNEDQKILVAATQEINFDPLGIEIKIEPEELLEEETHLEVQIMALDNMPDTSRGKSHTVAEKLDKSHDSNSCVHTLSIPGEPGDGDSQNSTTIDTEMKFSDHLFFKPIPSVSTTRKKRKGDGTGDTEDTVHPDAENAKKTKIKMEIKTEEDDDYDPDSF